jgi:hypothetical protein
LALAALVSESVKRNSSLDGLLNAQVGARYEFFGVAEGIAAFKLKADAAAIQIQNLDGICGGDARAFVRPTWRSKARRP